MIDLINIVLKFLAKTLEFMGKMFKTDIFLAIFVVVMFFLGIGYNIVGVYWVFLLILIVIFGISVYTNEELNTLDDYLSIVDHIKNSWNNKQETRNIPYNSPNTNGPNEPIAPAPFQPVEPREPIQPSEPVKPPTVGQEPVVNLQQPPTYIPPIRPVKPRPTIGGFQINRKSNSGLSNKAREKDAILDLEELLENNIKSQSTAIKSVISGLKRATIINNTKKTTLNFLMTGPTGTGKTEMVKLVAQGLKRPFTRYDMGSYKNEEQLWQLLGSPQGYIGGEGKLTQFVRNNPTACILFDEIEKGSDGMFDFMLPMLDEAIVKDNRSDQTIDFSKTIIFFTTNLVTNTPEEARDNPEIARDLILNKGFLRQEFVARIKNIVPFFEFSEDDIFDIVSIQLATYVKHIIDPRNENIPISCDDNVIEVIVSKVDRKYGARNVAQNIERLIGNLITDELFHRGQKKVSNARFWVENESIKLEVQ
ncbi:MAG: AAA family ATPase [Thaumarchaeota archaeon]|nr:AAA family ATPase [Nitrososphaerota archaeon]